MDRQQEDTRGTREGDGKRSNGGSKTKLLTEDTVKDLQKDIQDLRGTLKEIKRILNVIIKDKNSKIPGIK